MNQLDKQLNYIQELDPVTMAVLTTATLAIHATRLYKHYFTKAALRCKDLPQKEKAICMLQSKIFALQKKSTALKTALSKCSKTKNPQNCNYKLNTKIQDNNLLITTLKKRHIKLSKVES